MAGDGGRQSRSVEAQLYSDASRFSFLQAVRLLEQIARKRDPRLTPPGEHVDPRHELVHFHHAVRLDFPATDVERISLDDPPHLTVNVLGLTGPMGPLPHHVSELVLERTLRGDHAPRDFLDIFNHRLISLLYRARKKYRPALDARGPHHGRVATVLFSLLGLGTRGLRQRMGIDDRMLLAYAGLLVDQRRSAAGLERIIEHCFGAQAKVVPFQGQWQDIEEDNWTSIGTTGRNQLLGQGAMLGRRVWDQAASFEVRLGPLSTEKFRSFLPGGHAHGALVAVIRFYAREELGFTIRLVKRGVSRTRLHRLGEVNGARLGFDSWLKTRRSTPRVRLGHSSLVRSSRLKTRGRINDSQATFEGHS